MFSSSQAATRNTMHRFSRMRVVDTRIVDTIASSSRNHLARWRRTIVMSSSTTSSSSRCTNRSGAVLSRTRTAFRQQGVSSSLGFHHQLKVGGLLQPHQQQLQPQQVRSIFIQTAETPNPESLKFIPTGVHVLGFPTDDDDAEGSTTPASGYYVTRNDNQADILRSPLAKKLLDVDGVKAVYLGPDFVTVTKYAEGKWKLLRPQLFEVIMDWADDATNTPALLDHPVITDTTIHDDDSEIVAMIKELIEARIRPAVQEDGGDIRYVAFDEESGLVTVQLAGSCVGCPSSAVTLKQGVENMLMHYIPEVKAVEALEEEPDEGEEQGEGEKSDMKVKIDKSDDDEPMDEASKKQKTYQERLAQAGIPFSD
jgi:NFU1 iron-sulfur cluster scaffold homolog, mitochondrial